MTDKEKLLLQSYEIRNQINEVEGLEPLDIEALTNTWKFRDAAKKSTVAGLKETIENLTNQLERATKEKARKEALRAYLQTEEGKTKMDSLLLERTVEMESLKSYEGDMNKKFNRFAKMVIGEGWAVGNHNERYISFGVVNLDESEKREFVFGQVVEIWFERKNIFGEAKEKFEMSVGSTGCFDIQKMGHGDRARFYNELGRFLGKATEIQQLKEMLFDYSDNMEDFHKRIRNLNEQIKNPMAA